MPNIPNYAEPTVRPVTPQLALQTGTGGTADAFGAQEAEATSKFGGVMEQNASRFEQQAQALQIQDNEASANELTTQYLIKQSAITEEFKQLQGSQPKEAMEKYTRDLQELRATLRGTVPNAEVGRMFDRETQRQFGYAVMNGSSYAATQLRQYRDEQQKAVIDNKAATAADSANPKILKDQLDDLAESVRSSAAMRGKSPEAVDSEIRVQQAKVWGRWLPQLAENDPAAARQVLKANRASIDGGVAQKLEDVIDQQDNRVKAKQIASEVGGATSPTAPGQRAALEAQAKKKAEAYAKEQGLSEAKTAKLVETTTSTLDSWYQKQMTTLRDGQVASRNTVVGAINDGKITSLDDVIGPKADPLVRDGWLALDEPTKATLQKRINTEAAQKFAPSVPTAETINNRKRLSQLAVDDPDEFLKVDPTKEKLVRTDLSWLLNTQQRLLQKGANSDDLAATKRSVDSAVGVMEKNGLLDISGLRREDVQKDPANMARLRGALVQELDAFNVKSGGKPPNEQDLVAIGKKIVREEVSPTWGLGLFGGQKTKAFRPEDAAKPIVRFDDIPEGDRTGLIEGMKKAGIPQTQQNVRLYYQKLLDVRAAKGQRTDGKNEERVGQ